MANFKLQVFCTAARLQSFTKAAAQLYLTQSAVTKNIRSLEEELGTPLFIRGGGKVTLSTAGAVYYTYAQQMLDTENLALQHITQMAGNTAGVLNIAASTTIGQYVLPAYIARFAAAHPQVHVNMHIVNTRSVESQLTGGTIALGFIEGSTRSSALKYSAFMADELIPVARPGHSRFFAGPIPLGQLHKQPLVLREHGSGSRQVLESYLYSHGVNPALLNVQVTLGSTQAIISYLQQAPAIAFLSARAIAGQLANGTLARVPLSGFNLTRTFYYVQRQGENTPLAKAFINLITSRKTD